MTLYNGSELCTNSDALLIAYGRSTGLDYSTSVVNEAVSDATEEVLSEYGPAVKMKMWIRSAEQDYEYRRDRRRTYSIDLLQIRSPDTNEKVYKAPSTYTVDLQKNKLTFTSAQTGSWNSSMCEVDYIPYEWHLLAKNKAALNMLDQDMAQMNPGEGDADNPRVSRIAKRITRIQMSIRTVSAQGSYDNKDFDVRDRDRISQDRYTDYPIY